MATKTSQLGLTKPAYTDAADIAVLNGNFYLIDKAVGNGKFVQNLLDNSFFPSAFVINQRGASTYTAAGYAIDRWHLQNGTMTIGTSGITLTANADSNLRLMQYLEHLKNGTYTLAAKVNGEIKCRVVSYADGTFTTINSSGAGYTGGYLDTGGTYVILRANAGYTVNFEWAALYEGAYTPETLPTYVYKGYAAELAECQRYYFTMPNDPFANGQTIGVGNAALFSIQTPVALRVNEPTLDLHGGSLTIRCNGADYPVTAVSQQGKTGCFVYFMAQAEGLPAKHACASYVTGGTSKVALSADL